VIKISTFSSLLHLSNLDTTSSKVSTAFIAAGKIPVCHTISPFAKFTINASKFELSSSKVFNISRADIAGSKS
jgi:hypothetical protein